MANRPVEGDAPLQPKLDDHRPKRGAHWAITYDMEMNAGNVTPDAGDGSQQRGLVLDRDERADVQQLRGAREIDTGGVSAAGAKHLRVDAQGECDEPMLRDNARRQASQIRRAGRHFISSAQRSADERAVDPANLRAVANVAQCHQLAPEQRGDDGNPQQAACCNGDETWLVGPHRV